MQYFVSVFEKKIFFWFVGIFVYYLYIEIFKK